LDSPVANETANAGSDSGRMKNPYAAFIRLSAAAPQNGARRLTSPRNPPTAGPTMNPTPKATPRRPNFAARSSGGVTSAMYAVAVGKLDEVMPETTRPTNSHHNDGATAITM
jgi:hypothetical protein